MPQALRMRNTTIQGLSRTLNKANFSSAALSFWTSVVTESKKRQVGIELWDVGKLRGILTLTADDEHKTVLQKLNFLVKFGCHLLKKRRIFCPVW